MTHFSNGPLSNFHQATTWKNFKRKLGEPRIPSDNRQARLRRKIGCHSSQVTFSHFTRHCENFSTVFLLLISYFFVYNETLL